MNGYIEWNQLPQPPLGFPRGEAAGIDGTSEPASPADEGWRQVGSGMQLDEWHLLQFCTIQRGFLNFQALATPHQPRQNIGSEMPIFHRDSFLIME